MKYAFPIAALAAAATAGPVVTERQAAAAVTDSSFSPFLIQKHFTHIHT